MKISTYWRTRPRLGAQLARQVAGLEETSRWLEEELAALKEAGASEGGGR
jgi:hypothetical protein